MYISRLVKTRDPYPGLLQFAITSCLPFKTVFLYFLSILLFASYSLHPLSLLQDHSHLLPCGSAVKPIHILRGPSVIIPSVQHTKLSHLEVLLPHLSSKSD
jgi:hypothetical protein